MISAILLAAGQSRRMGQFKQLLTVAGKTFVEQCVDTLLASFADEIIVVTGHRESDVRHKLENRRVRFAHNPDYKEGMSTSIKRGVEAASDESDAVLIALVDQPLIETDTVNQLIEIYRKDRPLIIVPRYKGRNGHPIIMDMKLRQEILSMDTSRGLKPVREAHAGEVVYIEAASESVLIDFDLPEDYLRIKESDI
jgi:molybdenum cofactor cytidylyltransferase